MESSKVHIRGDRKPDEELALDQIRAGDEALKRRNFEEAIERFEDAIDFFETPPVWQILATTRFQQWIQAMQDQRRWKGGLDKHLESHKYSCSKIESYLRETYNVFIVAMEYKENKTNPELLLMLARLYLELGSYDGALSVCTLLVESYANFPKLNQALFLSAVATKCLNMHAQSAEYFAFVVEKPPYQLKSYFLLLLAAREYEFCAGAREKSRAAFENAYKLMITRRPNCPSEHTAASLEKAQTKSFNERLQLWYKDKHTWLDMAQEMMKANFPTLVLDVNEQALKRSGFSPPEMFLNNGLCYTRLGDQSQAQLMYQNCLHLEYFNMVCRYYLGQWVIEWKQQFEYEDTQAIVIQKRVRGNIGRVKAAKRRQEVLDALRRRSAIVIQCFIRVCQAKERLKHLRELQRQREIAENFEMRKRDVLMINRWLNHNASIIQTLRLIFQAKEERDRLRHDRKRRAELLQIAIGNSNERLKQIYLVKFKTYVAMKKQIRYDAAVRIQRRIQCYLCRKHLAKLKLDRIKQEKLISLALGTQIQKLFEKGFFEWKKWAQTNVETKHQSARKIQLTFRGYVARQQYSQALEKQKRMNNFMKQMIMERSSHTMYLCFKALLKNIYQVRQLKKQSAIQIQRGVRGFVARRKYRRMRSRAKKCEKFIIAFHKKARIRLLGMCLDQFSLNVQDRETFRHCQAVVIQTRIRGVLARLDFQKRKDYRLLYQSNQEETLKYRLEKDIYRLCFFSIRQYGPYCRWEVQTSAETIQRVYRGRLARREFRKNWQKMMIKKRVAEIFQKTFSKIATAFFDQLRQMRLVSSTKQNAAAKMIQTMTRKRFARDRLEILLRDRRKMMSLGHKIINRRKHQLLRMVLYGMKEYVNMCCGNRVEACILIQRRYRVRLARREARKVMAKKARQAKLLESINAKPAEYCFRKWEAILIEKCIYSVRSAAKSSFSSGLLKAMAEREAQAQVLKQVQDNQRSWEDDFEVPSMSFYTLLNRVRSSGVCHIPSGVFFREMELRQLILLSQSIVSDSEYRGWSTASRIIDILDGFEESPVQKLILYNSTIDLTRIAKLSQCISTPSHNLTSLVLGSTQIGNQGAKALALSLVTGACSIKQLVLDRCGIGNPGACALAEALCTNRTVWKLELNGNCLSDAACPHLSRMLTENTGIKVIGLANNNIGDIGILCYLSPAIANTSGVSQLELVSLSGNPRLSTSSHDSLTESWRSFRQVSIGKVANLRIDFGSTLGSIGSLSF